MALNYNVIYQRTRYESPQAWYDYNLSKLGVTPYYGFSGMLESEQERHNLTALVLRDYADLLHNEPDRSNDEAEIRALAAWHDTLAGEE